MAQQLVLQHADSPGAYKCVFRLLALIQSVRGGESRNLSLLRAKLQEALPGALALWPSGPVQGFLMPPYGFESARDVRWNRAGEQCSDFVDASHTYL